MATSLTAAAIVEKTRDYIFEDRGPDPQELEEGYRSGKLLTFYVRGDDNEITVCLLVLTHLGEYVHNGSRYICGYTPDHTLIKGYYKPLAHSEQDKRSLL